MNETRLSTSENGSRGDESAARRRRLLPFVTSSSLARRASAQLALRCAPASLGLRIVGPAVLRCVRERVFDIVLRCALPGHGASRVDPRYT
jgi:hypothetical protein